MGILINRYYVLIVHNNPAAGPIHHTSKTHPIGVKLLQLYLIRKLSNTLPKFVNFFYLWNQFPGHF